MEQENRRDHVLRLVGFWFGIPMTELWKYAFETIWDDGNLILSKAMPPGQMSQILVASPAHAQPSTMSLAQLEHAYALRNELDTSWAARPFELVRHQGNS